MQLYNCNYDLLNLNQSYIFIEIIDNGVGIPADNFKFIFDELRSDQQNQNWDGIGLGMSICADLAKKIDSFIQ